MKSEIDDRPARRQEEVSLETCVVWSLGGPAGGEEGEEGEGGEGQGEARGGHGGGLGPHLHSSLI